MTTGRLLYLASLAVFSIGLAGCAERSGEGVIVRASCNVKFVRSANIDIEDPSGLSLSYDGQSLWVVCNQGSTVTRMSLEGDIIESFQTASHDLEGVATIDSDRLAFIPERSRTIVIARKDGTILEEVKLPILGNDNRGPEALAYDSEAREFHVIKETPGQWVVLNENLEPVRECRLTFAMDYSSATYDAKKQQLWVMSDLSRSVHVLDIDGKMIDSFSFNIEQMEGLAVDFEAQRLYIVSDPLSKLFVFNYELSE